MLQLLSPKEAEDHLDLNYNYFWKKKNPLGASFTTIEYIYPLGASFTKKKKKNLQLTMSNIFNISLEYNSRPSVFMPRVYAIKSKI